jgi:CheY-like chemotaxis protein
VSDSSKGVVLLVEDEPLVRLVTADILMETGFRVVEAANVEEALTILRASVPVDVLLSDVEMPPGLNGYDLAREVRRAWPFVEILITSGREWPQDGTLPEGAAFLPKPCPSGLLVSHVEAAAVRARAARFQLAADQPAAMDDPDISLPKRA